MGELGKGESFGDRFAGERLATKSKEQNLAKVFVDEDEARNC